MTGLSRSSGLRCDLGQAQAGSNGSERRNVRFWHLADMDTASENVRYWG